MVREVQYALMNLVGHPSVAFLRLEQQLIERVSLGADIHKALNRFVFDLGGRNQVVEQLQRNVEDLDDFTRQGEVNGRSDRLDKVSRVE